MLNKCFVKCFFYLSFNICFTQLMKLAEENCEDEMQVVMERLYYCTHWSSLVSVMTIMSIFKMESVHVCFVRITQNVHPDMMKMMVWCRLTVFKNPSIDLNKCAFNATHWRIIAVWFVIFQCCDEKLEDVLILI